MRNCGKQCHSPQTQQPNTEAEHRGRKQRPDAEAGNSDRTSRPETATGHRGQTHLAPRPHTPQPPNVACNSLPTTSNLETAALELQRFQRLLKLHPIELHAKLRETVPQLTQQVARRHERPWPPADTKGRGPGRTPRPRPRRYNVRCRRSPRRARDPRNAPRTRRRDRFRRSAHAPPARASRTDSRCASPRC